MNRRTHLLGCLRAACATAIGMNAPLAWASGRQGTRPSPGDGKVLLLRHARAPGTFDPPGFTPGDCSTQRNLDATGRAQAQAIGQWFKRQRLAVDAVLSSPWCRCMDTAQLAFGQVQAWGALGSPVSLSPSQRQEQLKDLRQRLAAVKAQGGLQVWVTHMFVQQDLTGQSTASGQGLLVQHSTPSDVVVMDTWQFG